VSMSPIVDVGPSSHAPSMWRRRFARSARELLRTSCTSARQRVRIGVARVQQAGYTRSWLQEGVRHRRRGRATRYRRLASDVFRHRRPCWRAGEFLGGLADNVRRRVLDGCMTRGE